MFAPCVVSVRKWENLAEMEKACNGVDGKSFQDMLTVSDEAFMLLIIENYATKWFAEYMLQSTKVSCYEKFNI